MNFGVTGANGYVGSVISKYLRKEGHTVYEFKRKPDKEMNPFWIPYDLSMELAQEHFRKLDVLIHCAYDFQPSNWTEIQKVNIEGSRRLFQTARLAGVNKIIFISTMSAFSEARSMYGRAKLEIEKEASHLGSEIVRPGLVYGPRPGGMMGALLGAVSKFKIIPLIGGGNQIFYLCHQKDLARLIVRLSHSTGLHSKDPICAASENGLAFKNILQILAEYKGRKISFISLPWKPIYLALKVLEMLGFKTRFKSDSLISMLHQDQSPNFDAARQMGVSFLDFNKTTIDSEN